MELGLEGRRALVGGASKGLGRAAAEALAAEGCRLALWSRGGERLERAAAEIREVHAAEAHSIGADARDPAAASAVWAAAMDALGGVDVLVLNSGGPPTVDPTATEPDSWRQAFQLLAITPIQLATLALPGMRERRWGRIVAIMSSTVRQPIPNLVYSSGGRTALAAWMKTTAASVAGDGVTINGVLPGRIDTDRVAQLDAERAEREGRSVDAVRADGAASIPAGRYGHPSEVGAVVAFLAGARASYVTGTLLPVDGGVIQGL